MNRADRERIRRIAGMVLLLLAVLFLSGTVASAENLIENGSFEELDPDGLPSGWQVDAYLLDEGYTVFAADAARKKRRSGSPRSASTWIR